MEATKGGGRANRCQRDARHARRAPTKRGDGISLARREAREGALGTVLLAALLALAVLMCGLMGGPDDEADLMAHDRWMRQLEEEGAWVMW